MGTPNYPKDMASEWNQLKRDVRNAFTSANLRTGMAKIGAKVIEITGELALNVGATLRAQYANGVNALYVGPGNYNGKTVAKVGIRRYDGSQVLSVFGSADEPGYFSIQDPQGNIIVSDDGMTGIGLARPWIPYGWTRTADITTPRDITTSSTFVAHHTISGYLQHPKIVVWGFLVCNASDRADVRIKDTDSGQIVASATNLATGWVTLEGSVPNYGFGDFFKYDIEVRRASGTGTGVGFTVTSAHGRQS